MVFRLAFSVDMPDRRGRSYREWSSDESESEESESDHANESLPPPPRARTVAVEPSPFTVTASQETMPFAMDVSCFHHARCARHSSRRVRQLFSCLQEELVQEGFRAVRFDNVIDDAPAVVGRLDQAMEVCQVCSSPATSASLQFFLTF